MVFVILALYICSFFFIFEAQYMPDSIRQQADIEIPTKENTYAVDNGDGTFDSITAQASHISPLKDDIRWVIRIINGKKYKRLFNYSAGMWIGDWIPFS